MCWRKLLTDTHCPVFCLLTILLHSTQRQKGPLTGNCFSRAASAAAGQKTQTVADYVIDGSALLMPELTARCLEWLLVGEMDRHVTGKWTEWSGKQRRANWDVHSREEQAGHIWPTTQRSSRSCCHDLLANHHITDGKMRYICFIPINQLIIYLFVCVLTAVQSLGNVLRGSLFDLIDKHFP